MHQLLYLWMLFSEELRNLALCCASGAKGGGLGVERFQGLPGVWGFSLAVWGVRFGGNLRKFWAAGLRDVRRHRHVDVCFGTAKLPSL